MASPYTYATFADLKASLAGQLSDVSMVFWTSTELGIYINAALREWNAIARMFRDRGSFATTVSDTFYDLRTLLKNGANEAFLNPVITDAQLLQQGKYLLMEPVPGDATSFTDGITANDFSEGFTRRRNQFLLETGLIISQTSQAVVSGSGRVVIADDSVIDIRRASWLSPSGAITTLFREDEFTSQSFSPAWLQSTGTPRRYSIYPDPLLTIQLIPPPSANGTLILQTISSGAILDDFTPYILWGVLADILSSPGPSSDPMRAEYCEQRFREGAAVAKQVTTVMQSLINGVPVSTDSTFSADVFKPSWTTTATPRSVGLLGSNLAAVIPRANVVASVTMDSVRNAPQLVNDADKLPIGREYLTTIINYAAHLCTFKQGGAEFQATFNDYDAFVKAAVGYSNRLLGQNLHVETLVDRARRQEEEQPLRVEAAA